MIEKIKQTYFQNSLTETAKAMFATATLRQSGITFVGTVLNGAFGAIFYILSARALGPASFGVVSVAISVAMLVSSVGDFGIDTGLVRFVSGSIKNNKPRAYRFLKLSLKIKIVIGGSIALLGIVISGTISQLIFQKPELTPALRIAFTATFTTLLLSFVVSGLKAMQKFFLWSVIQISTNLFRVLIILGLFVLGTLTTSSSLWTYSLCLLAGAIFGFLFLIPKDFLKVKNEISVAKELFHYNKWIACFTLVAAVSSKLDTIIAARLLTATEVGLYSAAYQSVYIVPQIVGALGTVIAPKMAEMAGGKIVPYLKKTQLLVLGLAGLGLLGIPIVSFLIPIIFGAQYFASIPLFIVLLLAMLVFLLSVPVSNAVLYYYSYPRLYFWLALGHLAIMGIGGWILISSFGAMGAAFTVLIGSIFNFAIPAIWVVRKLRVESRI